MDGSKYCCRRVDGVRCPLVPRVRLEMAAALEMRARPLEALLPPDEEYGRDGRTRCAAEIRSATNTLAHTNMIIRCFKRKRAHL